MRTSNSRRAFEQALHSLRAPQRHIYFQSNWACSTALSTAPGSLGLLALSGFQDDCIRRLLPLVANDDWSAHNLCLNSNCIEDTDLYFLCKEFPPPAYFTSQFVLDVKEGVDSFVSKKKGTFALLDEGTWKSSSKHSEMRPLTQREISRHSSEFPLLLNQDQEARDTCWERLIASIASDNQSTGEPLHIEQTSLHERLELVLRGHTQRLPSHLFISLDTIILMKLSLVPGAAWHLYCQSVAPQTLHTSLNKSLLARDESASSSSLPHPPLQACSTYVLTEQDLIHFGKR